jgi:hypothetical protein
VDNAGALDAGAGVVGAADAACDGILFADGADRLATRSSTVFGAGKSKSLSLPAVWSSLPGCDTSCGADGGSKSALESAVAATVSTARAGFTSMETVAAASWLLPAVTANGDASDVAAAGAFVERLLRAK